MMTVWHRPIDADIVPLARFQIKQKEQREEDERVVNGASR